MGIENDPSKKGGADYPIDASTGALTESMRQDIMYELKNKNKK